MHSIYGVKKLFSVCTAVVFIRCSKGNKGPCVQSTMGILKAGLSEKQSVERNTQLFLASRLITECTYILTFRYGLDHTLYFIWCIQSTNWPFLLSYKMKAAKTLNLIWHFQSKIVVK